MTRTAIVTGAGSGIGRATAVALAGAGFRVALLGRTESTLRETATLAGDALVLVCDVSIEQQVSDAFATAKKEFDHLDVLVNNAGVFGPAGDVSELSVAEFESSIATNVTGTFMCSREAFLWMKSQHPLGGRIINNGSISAQVPRPGNVAYTVAKHAITGLTKSIALDGRPFDIACGQIDIGNATTDMTATMESGIRQPDGSVRPEAMFDVVHAAEAFVYMAQLPLSANVLSMTLTATTMPFVGRG